jgi:tetratricopeptide (TPR) repeat protein
VAEKIPLMLLCLASCILTMWAQRAGGAIVPAQDMAWQEHCLQPLASYSLYLGKLFWPAELAIFYPYTRLAAKDLIWLVALPILLSALCLWQRRRRPHLLVGWLWFVIMLIPVIGFVRVGMQSIADRYTYLPSIGIFIAVAWAMAEIAAISKPWRAGMACSGFMMLLACGADTRYQLGFWRDDISLFKHVEAVTTKHNFLGCFFLGNAYRNLNDLENAASNYTRALEMAPGFIPARAKLGYVLLLQEKYPAAEAEFRTILRQEPENIYAHTSLGLALSGQQRDTDARLEYQAALQLKPDDASLKEYLSTTTRRLSVEQDLTDLFSQLKTNDTPQIHCQIAVDQNFLGHYQSAVEQYQITLAIAPDSLEGLNNLAWLLATCSDAGVRDGKRAVELAQHACQLTGEKKTVVLGTLAAAYAEAGRFDEAIATAQKACASATAKGETELLAVNQKLLAQYQQHQPYHEAAEKLVPGAP